MISSCEMLISGRDFNLLLSRLNKRGVNVKKAVILSNNKLIIKINCQDMQKVFEVCGNMWYNTKVKYHGLKRLVDIAREKFLFIAAVALFVAAVFILGNFIISFDLSEVPSEYKNRVSSALAAGGAKRFNAFNNVDYDGIEKKLLSFDGVDYAEVGKSGYSIKVFIKKKDGLSSTLPKRDRIVSVTGGVITAMTVYRGRALKKVGDQVAAGEILVDGVTDVGDGVTENSYCQALVVVRASYTEETEVIDTSTDSISHALLKTALFVGCEHVDSAYEIIPFGEKFLVRATVFYNVVYGD